MDQAYWTKKLRQAQADAARTRTGVNAAAKKRQRAKVALKEIEPAAPVRNASPPKPPLSPVVLVLLGSVVVVVVFALVFAPRTGIAPTWAFPIRTTSARPVHRCFAQMIKGPLYQILLGHHRSHEIKEVSRSDNEAVFAVTVTSQTGAVVGYRWSVAKGRGCECRRMDDHRGVSGDSFREAL